MHCATTRQVNLNGISITLRNGNHIMDRKNEKKITLIRGPAKGKRGVKWWTDEPWTAMSTLRYATVLSLRMCSKFCKHNTYKREWTFSSTMPLFAVVGTVYRSVLHKCNNNRGLCSSQTDCERWFWLLKDDLIWRDYTGVMLESTSTHSREPITPCSSAPQAQNTRVLLGRQPAQQSHKFNRSSSRLQQQH